MNQETNFQSTHFSDQLLLLYEKRFSNELTQNYKDFFESLSFYITRGKKKCIFNHFLENRGLRDESPSKRTKIKAALNESVQIEDFSKKDIKNAILKSKSSCVINDVCKDKQSKMEFVLDTIEELKSRLIFEDQRYFFSQRDSFSKLKVISYKSSLNI